jgi:hypothetical protein
MCACSGREHRMSSCYLCRVIEADTIEPDTDDDE